MADAKHKDPSIGVLGPGGVGGCLAAILTDRGVRVTCIVREAAVPMLRRQGIILESVMHGRLVTQPEVVPRLKKPLDILFVTTKAYHLEQALDRIDPELVAGATVIPLLNGIEHMETIRRWLGRRLAAGSIRIEAKANAPGRIIHSSPFLVIKLASDGDIPTKELADRASFLSANGIETQVEQSEAQVLWDKLVRLVALACTTAAVNRPIGFIRNDAYWRKILENIVREAGAVAKASGVSIDCDMQMKILNSMPETLTSSMQRDIASGRPSELDAIAGGVIRAGMKMGLSCPTIDDLVLRITKNEGGH